MTIDQDVFDDLWDGERSIGFLFSQLSVTGLLTRSVILLLTLTRVLERH